MTTGRHGEGADGVRVNHVVTGTVRGGFHGNPRPSAELRSLPSRKMSGRTRVASYFGPHRWYR
ncbi:hypothetical protein SAMN05216275_102440 [Streptosporangium canum]|uniref:Uncharacterized protein n=1 Tax=Streptosporangium canum TaxID=324952 RepID=A0A1I3HBT8_9ACTN|nr:hypothetical protein SAMN05216275_102440 [Streptosporangium canum]